MGVFWFLQKSETPCVVSYNGIQAGFLTPGGFDFGEVIQPVIP